MIAVQGGSVPEAEVPDHLRRLKPISFHAGLTRSLTELATAVTYRIDHTARLWDAATGKPMLTLSGHTDAVVAVAWGHTARLWTVFRSTQDLVEAIKSSVPPDLLFRSAKRPVLTEPLRPPIH